AEDSGRGRHPGAPGDRARRAARRRDCEAAPGRRRSIGALTMGMFDDLIPTNGPAASTALAAPGGGGMFGDLIPAQDAKPSIDDPAYSKFMAAKHGVDPGFVEGLRHSVTQTAAVHDIPVLGGLAQRAEPYISALAQPLTGAGAPGASISDRA